MNSPNAKSVKQMLSNSMSIKADVYTNALQCSDALCAVLVSDLSRERVSATLDDLSRDKVLADTTSGGYMRILEQDGTYFGLFVTVIDDGRAFSIR